MKTITKDITTVERGILVNGVNCQKAMGSGVAYAYMMKWPFVRTVYMDSPFEGKSALGKNHLINVGDDPMSTTNLFVSNSYTQEFFGNDGKVYASVEAIEECLTDLAVQSKSFDLPIYLPQVGCGLGGLDWERDVVPVINRIEATHNIELTVCLWS